MDLKPYLCGLLCLACCLHKTAASAINPNDTYTGVVCRYNDQEYEAGEFQLSPCVHCHCERITGILTCTHQECPKMENGTEAGCIRYGPPAGKCCPECLEHGCIYNGASYPKGVQVPSTEQCKNCY